MNNRDGTEWETHDAWLAKGRELFGADYENWKFVCPACKKVRAVSDYEPYKDKGATPDSAATECLGRYTGGRNGPDKCDWAAYGLFAGPSFVTNDNGKRIPCFMFDGE